MTVIEGNKLKVSREELSLIEKFMGYADGYLSEIITWNDLMPLVEKIHILREVREILITPGKTRIWLAKGSYIQSPHKPGNNSITECWLAVVDFIQWYNSQ